MFQSIKWKLMLLYILLIVVAMQFVSFFLVRNIEAFYLERARTELRTRGAHVVRVLEIEMRRGPYSRELAETLLNNLRARQEDAMIVLVSPRGQVAATSLNPTAERLRGLFVQSPDYPAIVEFFATQAPQEARWEDHTGRRFYTLALPLSGILTQGTARDEVALVYVREPLDETYSILQEVQARLLNATLLAIGVTLLLGTFAAQTITRPLQEVTSKAARLASGHFDMEVTVKSRDEIGKLAQVFNFLTAELRKTMTELRNDKTKLEAILTQMTNGVIAVDTHGHIIHANIRARDMLGITPETSSAAILEVLNLGDIARLLQGSGPKVAETELKAPYTIAVRAYAAPFHSADGEVSGGIIVLQDITEEARLAQMRREFVANVSHELKTPLTTIKGYAETLLSGALDTKDVAASFLSTISEEADRMDRLIKDLLTLSALDFQQARLTMRPTLLDELILDVADKLAFAAQKRNLRFRTDFLEEVPAVMANADKVEQVLINIMSNAIKYTHEGSDITVSVMAVGDMVRVGIKDQGPGIPKEDQPRIFERFYRVDKARARELGGTGLGLAIAKQIVEAHGGWIGLESAPNQGTEIYFFLPRHAPNVGQVS
ncbi:MAG: Sensor histidine kinase WalK [Firmicutes bacterium]|nr:Sensor histidine kinase WalK [Bacillota bacterium]